MKQYNIKSLSGDIVTLNIEKEEDEKENEKENENEEEIKKTIIEKFRYPKNRTVLLKDSDSDNLYFLFINPTLNLQIFISYCYYKYDEFYVCYIKDVIKTKKLNEEINKIDEKYDGYVAEDYKGTSLVNIKFLMPSDFSFYRLYVILSEGLKLKILSYEDFSSVDFDKNIITQKKEENVRKFFYDFSNISNVECYIIVLDYEGNIIGSM